MAAKPLTLLLLSCLLVAGCAGAPAPSPSSTSASPRFGHEHSVFRMFVDGQEVSFMDPTFDYSHTRYPRAHLHLGGSESTKAQYVIHEEGQLGATLGEFFATLGVTLSPTRVQLDSAVHGGRVVENNATGAWQLWVDPCAPPVDDWARSPPFEGYAPRQHDRMLLTFAPANATTTSLGPEFAKIPPEAELGAEIGDRC